MPTPSDRPSLKTDLLSRYSNQRVGSAFDVKRTLNNPNSSPAVGTTIDAESIQGANFQTPNGFEVKKSKQGITQMKDANTEGSSKELSLFIKGFSNKKYKR